MSLIRPSLYISGNLADNVLYSIDVIWKFILWGERLKRFHNWRVTHIHYTSSFPSSLVQSIEHRAGNKLQQKWISLFFKVLLSHFHGKISQLGIHAQEFFFFEMLIIIRYTPSHALSKNIKISLLMSTF